MSWLSVNFNVSGSEEKPPPQLQEKTVGLRLEK